LPITSQTGVNPIKAPPIAAAANRDSATSCQRSSAIRINAWNSINPTPTGSASARHTSDTSSVVVSTNASSCAYSTAAGRIIARNNTAVTIPIASSRRLIRTDAMPCRAVMRRCAPRCTAMTAPSMASQRKSVEAISSVQMIGRLNT
jgi:hypothetical protein